MTKHIRHAAVFGMISVVFLLPSCNSAASDSIQDSWRATDLIDRCRRAQSWLRSTDFKVEVRISDPDQLLNPVAGHAQFTCQGDYLRGTGYSDTLDRHSNTEIPNTTYHFLHVVGTDYYLQQKGLTTARMGANVGVARNTILFDHIMGPALEGYFFGNDTRSVLSLLCEPDMGSPTTTVYAHTDGRYYLQRSTRYGQIRASLDPGLGFNAVSWSVRKNQRHLWDNTRIENLAPRKDGLKLRWWEATLADVTFERVQESYIAVRGKIVVKMEFENNTGRTVIYEYERKNININQVEPQPVELPVGSEIILDESPGILFEWTKLGLVPKVDRDVISGIHDAVFDWDGGNLDGPIPEPITFVPSQITNAYCGLYCLYAYFRMSHIGPIDFRALLTEKYIGSASGSSLLELQRAASDFGQRAEIATNLTISALRAIESPIILHLDMSPANPDDDHFVLFLGLRNQHALILDPPKAIEKIPLGQLLARWSRHGLILGDGADSFRRFVWLDRARTLAIALVSCACVISLSHLTRRRRLHHQRTQLAGFLCVLGLSVITTISYDVVTSDGLLAAATIQDDITAFHRADQVQEITLQRASSLHAEGALFVDARLPASFHRTAIPGAINIPAHTSYEDVLGICKNVSKDTVIVVYCQNADCGFAKNVAQALLLIGYNRVFVFPGGWDEWTRG